MHYDEMINTYCIVLYNLLVTFVILAPLALTTTHSARILLQAKLCPLPNSYVET